MRILFFSPYFYPYTSGVTTYPQKILSHLAKKNHIKVLTFRFNSELSNQVTLNQLTIIRMPFLFRLSKGFISLQSVFYFLKYCQQTDLVILNQPNFEGLLLAIFAKLFNKKIVSIFHCQVFLDGNIVTKIINGALNLSMKTQLRASDRIIVYTKDYINSLPYFKNFDSKILEVLPPIEKFLPNKLLLNKLLKLKKNDIWIGYAGRIASEKGIEYLVQSINRLYIRQKNIVLVFAGPRGADVAGENIYYDKIIKMLREYKIKHIFLGNLTNDRLGSFYKAIDILVLPSINQTEAFGMVQAEAMLAGTPVIASNLPGVRIPIKLTRMGIIVEPKNVEKLSKSIGELLKNKEKYSNKILVAKAQQIFTIKKTYEAYDHFLTTL